MSKKRRSRNAAFHRSQIGRARRFIRLHMDSRLGLDDIAREAGASPFHFVRIFLAYTGETPFDFLRRVRLALQATRVARQEFVAAHRPRLTIRQIRFTGFSTHDSSRINMHCDIANTGDGEGRIIDGRYHVEFSDGKEFEPIEEGGDPFVPHSIPAGGVLRMDLGLNLDAGAHLAWTLLETRPNAQKPYFRGLLYYVDGNNIARRTYFSRRYEPGTDRFMPTNDPEDDCAD